MIPIDTWAVIAADDSNVILECPFMPENGTWTVPIEEIGIEECKAGDIFSTETGGWLYLEYEELNDLTDEGQKIFWDYIKRKRFTYYGIKRYGFIADR
ncbi:MAG: hypothetical protein IJ806_04200 [Ruminococcus sp.]|nr:hypothetical protein [Ruminococcus sp.]